MYSDCCKAKPLTTPAYDPEADDYTAICSNCHKYADFDESNEPDDDGGEL
jgi:hypothetical protein